jgi:uncharacterized protein (DUF2141 family)
MHFNFSRRRGPGAILAGATVALSALALAGPASAQTALGPDSAHCRAGASAPALLVNVSGFKSRSGRVRVNVYGSNPGDFLAKGKMVRRIDLPVTANQMRVCVALPKAGRYAVAVRHDADGNGKSGWNDGGGFSRNPTLSLARLRPSYDEVAIAARGGVTTVPVVLNYRRGGSIGRA